MSFDVILLASCSIRYNPFYGDFSLSPSRPELVHETVCRAHRTSETGVAFD
jgi:hypothetical protein